MNARNQDTTRVLDYAIERETETRDYYKSCLQRVTVDSVKGILRGLVEDEQQHRDILQRLLNNVSRGETLSVEIQQSEAAKVRLERAFSHAAIDDANFKPESRDIRGILGKALEIEKESFTNYSKAAQDSSIEELRAIYRLLAGEENKHYIIIDNLMSYLDVPGKWLYTEENLVFQNG